MDTSTMFISKYDRTTTFTLVSEKETFDSIGFRKEVTVDQAFAREYQRIMSEYLDLQKKLEQFYQKA